MTSPSLPDSYWLKAVNYINRSFHARTRGQSDEAALWASLSLEHLGKAALAQINPALIAATDDDGKNLMIAAGVSRDQRRFKAIGAAAVYSRCSRAFREFDGKEATRIAGNRNEELHEPTPGFAGLPAEIWFQRYWAQAVILLTVMGSTLEDFVGADHVSGVEAALATNQANLERRVRVLLDRFLQRLERSKEGSLSLKEAGELTSDSAKPLSYSYSSPQSCPACDEAGFLAGEYVLDSELDYDPDLEDYVEYITVASEEFRCRTCGLHLETEAFLSEAGLPDQFQDTREPEYEGEEYGND